MAKINKIMLVVPNTKWSGLKQIHIFPYAIGLLSTVLKDKYDVRVLDANLYDLGMEDVAKRISDYKPDILAVSCGSFTHSRDYDELISIAKKAHPGTITVAGGAYPTISPEEMMTNKDLDYAFSGEGEYRFPRLLQSIETGYPSLDEIDGITYRAPSGEIKSNPLTSYIQNLDELPYPFYDNLDFNAYANKSDKFSPFDLPRKFPYAYTATSRGCPFKCVFCSTRLVNGPGIRYRSPESVLKEIDWLVSKYGVKEIDFMDENLFLDRERIKEILKGLIKRNYDLIWKDTSAAIYALDDELLELSRESGCYQLALAVEAGTLEGLKLLNKPYPSRIFSTTKSIVKKAKSLGFELLGTFVIGVPGETWEQIRETFRLADELDLDYCGFNIATPLPKTDLYRIAKEKNLISKDFSFNSKSFSGFAKASISTDEFTPQELRAIRAYEWDRINFRNKDKIKKACEICRITPEELNTWRVETRRNFGVIK